MRTISSLILNYILILTAMHMSGCASMFGDPHESINYKSTTGKIEFSPREKSEVTQLTPKELTRKNYVNLGHIGVGYTIEECSSEKRTNCSTLKHDDTPTDRTLKEAAKRGGDLVRLEVDNKKEDSVRYVNGRCLRTRIEPYSVYEDVYDLNAGKFVKKSRPAETCLHYEQIPYAVTLLLSEGDIWRHDPFYTRQEELRHVLEAGNQTQVKKYLTKKSQFDEIMLDGESYPLYIVVKNDNVEALKVMLELGMHPDQELVYKHDTQNNKTILMYPYQAATEARAEKSKKVLLQYGASIRDQYGRTEYVLEIGNRAQVKKYLTSKSQIDQVLSDGESYPIYLVLKNDNVEALQVMLELGIDPNAPISYKQTNTSATPWARLPFEIAIELHAEKCKKLLLQRGADPNLRAKSDPNLHAKYGRTRLWGASFRGDYEEVKQQLKQGININAADDNGDTALVASMPGGHHKVVRLLLENGADPNIRNKDGKSALEVARQILEYAKNSPQPEFIKNLEAIVQLLSR